MDTVMFEGILLRNVHNWQDCQYHNGVWVGRDCVIHWPTPHHMRLWTLVWRDDRGIFERICAHGIGHPDPDQFDYWRENGILDAQAAHGCDGCCQPPLPEEPRARWSTWPGRSTSTATTARNELSGGLESAPLAARVRMC